jgi:hypothetical protein
MGDTTAETKALIEEARQVPNDCVVRARCHCILITALADALEATEADNQRLRAVLAKVNALADDLDNEVANTLVHTGLSLGLVSAKRDAARRLRLAVQVDQEEHGDE